MNKKEKEQLSTALGICKFIDELELSYFESRDLWKILTALRGPDNEDLNIKLSTTAVIRELTFPNLAGTSGAHTARKEDWLIPNNLDIGNHFKQHILAAGRVLKLEI